MPRTLLRLALVACVALVLDLGTARRAAAAPMHTIPHDHSRRSDDHRDREDGGRRARHRCRYRRQRHVRARSAQAQVLARRSLVCDRARRRAARQEQRIPLGRHARRRAEPRNRRHPAERFLRHQRTHRLAGRHDARPAERLSRERQARSGIRRRGSRSRTAPVASFLQERPSGSTTTRSREGRRWRASGQRVSTTRTVHGFDWGHVRVQFYDSACKGGDRRLELEGTFTGVDAKGAITVDVSPSRPFLDATDLHGVLERRVDRDGEAPSRREALRWLERRSGTPASV